MSGQMVKIDDLTREQAIAILKDVRDDLSGDDASDICLSIMDKLNVDSRTGQPKDDTIKIPKSE